MAENGDAGACDLVAVGGGLAGLSAALRALELGLGAAVLEASPEVKNLSASRVNGGVYHLAFLSVTTDAAALARAVVERSGGFVAPALARALADNALRAVRWLEANGAEFAPMRPDDGWKDFVLVPHGFHESATLVWEGLGADRLIGRLEAAIGAAGGRIERGRRVTGLIVEGGRCRGVIARGPGGIERWRAGAVVLADGGFHGDPELLRRFVTPHPERLKLRGTPSGRGDGIRLAEAAGARLVGMDAFYGHLLSADCLDRDALCPFPFLDFLAEAGIMVDATGARFVDEGRGGHAMANALARHGAGRALVVFDEAIWEGAGRHFFRPPNPHLVEDGGTLHRAGDIAALAALAGLPAAALGRTVEAHNAALDAGTPDRLTPPRSTARHPALPIRTPPFYAAPACAAITHTMGGVAVDARARAVGRDGRPIPGLYAAGSTAGGLEGGPDAAYLGGLIKAVAFGLLAAETAAEAAAGAPAERAAAEGHR